MSMLGITTTELLEENKKIKKDFIEYIDKVDKAFKIIEEVLEENKDLRKTLNKE